jgi:hypothetical protein
VVTFGWQRPVILCFFHASIRPIERSEILSSPDKRVVAAYEACLPIQPQRIMPSHLRDFGQRLPKKMELYV